MSNILNEKKKSTDETNFVKDFLKLEIKIKGAFNDYVCRFDKRDSSINADFAAEVNWSDKGKSTGKHLPSAAKD